MMPTTPMLAPTHTQNNSEAVPCRWSSVTDSMPVVSTDQGRSADGCSGRWRVPLVNDRTHSGQPVRDRRAAQVGAGHRIPHSQQNLRDSAHANPADADKVDPLRWFEEEVPGQEHTTSIYQRRPAQVLTRRHVPHGEQNFRNSAHAHPADADEVNAVRRNKQETTGQWHGNPSPLGAALPSFFRRTKPPLFQPTLGTPSPPVPLPAVLPIREGRRMARLLPRPEE